MNTTTKRFPRSLSEAFPTGTEYANSIERYKRIDTSGITIIFICGVGLACLVVGLWV